MSYKTCGQVWGHLQAESQTDGQALACKTEDKKEYCSNCKKSGHTKDKCFQNKVKGNVFDSVSDTGNCRICYESPQQIYN